MKGQRQKLGRKSIDSHDIDDCLLRISIHPQLEGTFLQQNMGHKIVIGSRFQANKPTQGVSLENLHGNQRHGGLLHTFSFVNGLIFR